MKDSPTIPLPLHYTTLRKRSDAIGFRMPSDEATGGLIRCLVASKTSGRILELGTGTGLGACWLLDGMDVDSRLDSVELEDDYQRIARDVLSHDSRVVFYCEDGLSFLERAEDETYDFIYADTWPGKYIGFQHSLRVLRRGGILVMDDMLPQPNWPPDHPPKVEQLLRDIDALPHNFAVVKLCWFTGHIIITKMPNQSVELTLTAGAASVAHL
jgi:predicted O-methyltransferase YrrM